MFKYVIILGLLLTYLWEWKFELSLRRGGGRPNKYSVTVSPVLRDSSEKVEMVLENDQCSYSMIFRGNN